MSSFDDAQHLVDEAYKQLSSLKTSYGESLSEQNVSPRLLVQIKNLLENLRSALDFSAVALFKAYGNGRANVNIYFPYSSPPQTNQAYLSRVEKCIPGLSSNRPDIAAHLESFQYFSGKEQEWLPQFMALNNENKHSRLSPQVRRVTKKRILSGTGESKGRIIIGEKGVVSLIGSANVGNAVIRGGQTITVDTEAIMEGGSQEVTEWVTFHFTENDSEVIDFLERSTAGVANIVATLRCQ